MMNETAPQSVIREHWEDVIEELKSCLDAAAKADNPVAKRSWLTTAAWMCDAAKTATRNYEASIGLAMRGSQRQSGEDK